MPKYCKICLLVVFFVVAGSWFQSKAEAAAVFTDVSSTYWAKEEIEYLFSKDVIEGYDEGGGTEFRPENKVTRAQAAKMIVLAKGKTKLTSSGSSFKDVPSDDWASGWIERAVSLGYFTGYKDGTFHPYEHLTRAQMSKVIALAFGLDYEGAADKPIVFPDGSASWASSFINSLYYSGISNGSNGYFKPNLDISRAQFSAFLSRGMSDQFKLPLLGNPIATGTVTADSLNVRTAPTTSGSVAGALNLGDKVNVYDINGYWAKIAFNGQAAYVHKTYLKLNNLSGNQLRNRIIVIDAGHGGVDSGAIGGSYYEKTVTLNVALKVQEKLKNAGANVMLTRESDTYPTLEDRVKFSQDHYAELFVSIHVNSASATSASGAESYYNIDANDNGVESSKLASTIQTQIVSMANMRDRGVKEDNWYVIKNQEIPAVLIELGFISNPEDRAKLTSATYVNLYATAIYNGINNYYSNN
ncbi:N-acetylmuramoyl-L-alanine amidase [Falsibacillus pallidus]|uniref:N-acetylmuramoyl-L-alanine amidase n=1 Tax=Falsibacillus pallidus TaxID=493781 RepID=UPI003D9581E3